MALLEEYYRLVRITHPSTIAKLRRMPWFPGQERTLEEFLWLEPIVIVDTDGSFWRLELDDPPDLPMDSYSKFMHNMFDPENSEIEDFHLERLGANDNFEDVEWIADLEHEDLWSPWRVRPARQGHPAREEYA